MSTSTILILDLPAKTFVGIDLVSFDSSPNFHGIVNIPTGNHFLYTGTDAALAIRHGRWLSIEASTSKPQDHVLRWNSEHESLSLLDSSDDSATAARASIPSLQGRGLVDFTALQDASLDLQSKSRISESSGEDEADDTWSRLSSYITAQTLHRIMPGDISPSRGDTQPSSWTISSISTSPQDNESIPGLDAEESQPILQESGASALQFVSINLKQTWPDDSVGRDRTDKARDKSWYLSSIIDGLSHTPTADPSTSNKTETASKRQRGARELLAELQFCFVMVLTLANYSALEQWKRILSVVFGCKSALLEIEPYFIELIKILRQQLARIEDVEGGLFEMSDEIGSQWLRYLLKDFRATVNEMLPDQGEKSGLKGALGELETWLRNTYGWADEGNMLKRGMIELEDGEMVEVQMDELDEEEETGEYAPVVVET